MPTNLVSKTGKVVTVDDPDVGQFLEAGFRPDTTAEQIARDTAARRAQDTPAAASAALGVLSGATFGGSDALFRAVGGEEGARQVRETKAAHPTAALVGEVLGGAGGALAGIGPAGAAARLGARVARVGEGAGAVARIGRAAAGAAFEGAAQGAGSAVSDLALSAEPLTAERAVSLISSRALFGAGIGGAAGTVGKGLELGLRKGKAVLDDAASAALAKGAGGADDVGADLAALDMKGLRAAEASEKAAIESTKVTARKELADEIVSFRRDLKASKQFLTTKDVDLAAAGDKLGSKELGRIAAKANKQLDSALDNPIGVAKNPAKVLDALQRQENALAKLLERGDDLRATFAADTSGTRMAALESVAPALERNRALQARINDLAAPPASPRLAAIEAAKDALQTGRGPKSLVEQAVSGTVFSAVTGVVAALPLPMTSVIAPLVGAKASAFVGDKVFGRLGAAMSEGQARTAQAIGRIFEKGAKAAKAAPPLASRTLSRVAFAPATEPDNAPPARKKLPELYRQRSAEIREMVAAGPTGAPVVRPAVRERIAKTLDAVGALHPVLADQMETIAVRRVEFLADKMPRRPDIGGIPIGPDRWQPSEMEMRKWARYVAAVEDPDGIVERVADGAITPEDAEVMRDVYPEMLADVTRQVLERIPELSATLPYKRRIALSILTGAAVDPSMTPEVIQSLQAQFSVEVRAPRAAPQFGSVKNHELGTSSERREQRS